MVFSRSPKIVKAVRSPTGGRQRFFNSARTHILAWYLALLAISTLITILAIRQTLIARVRVRVTASLEQEIEEFHQIIVELKAEKSEPSRRDIATTFNRFLFSNIPDDDEFLIAILGHQFYKSSPRALPKSLSAHSSLVRTWAKLSLPQQGEQHTSDGEILYSAEPIRINSTIYGVFVVAHITEGERREVNETIIVVTQVTLAMLFTASVLAWFAAGRVLAPLQLLADMARSIRESDLTQRISVKGSAEIAELSLTFNQMLDRLQAAFQAQKELIRDVSHELRTPVTIVRGHLEVMGNDPQERQETLDLVLDELERMGRFVNDLLLLTKAEQPNFLVMAMVELETLTAELYAKVQALGGCGWHLEAVAYGPAILDRQRLTQAVMSLAQNALQHAGSKQAIVIGSATQNEEVRFWVRDWGVGIPEDEQQNIFERFHRGRDSYRQREGTGLGLSIVKAIAAAHGGRVELISQPGNGSTFTIVIPHVIG